MAALMLVLVYAQVVVGAWFRHFGTAPALWSHVVLAVAVLGHSVGLVARVGRCRAEAPALWPSAVALGAGVTLQVVLGAAALWLILPMGGNPRTPTLWQAMVRTAHQTNGALLLASSVVLALRAFRHLGASPSAAPLPTARPEGVPRTMEVLA
jgi:cytochrome c oxidase assembly protein subunit 15